MIQEPLQQLPGWEHDALYCERVVRQHARTFALASRLLPGQKRRAVYALYAFCRQADDLVDRAPAEQRTRTLASFNAYRQQLDDALRGRGEGPVFREVARVVTAYGIASAPLHELLAGVERDLDIVSFENWEELSMYCEGVASSVGEMCTAVFGVDGDDGVRNHAVRYARTLGVAMQLTNILRDVGEDAARGRCYLPLADLAAFGLSRDEVLHDCALGSDERWRRLMIFEVARARSLYRAAAPGIALLNRDAQSCASACANGYAAILTAIEAQKHDTITRRARVRTFARIGILWDAWRYRAASPVPPGEAGLCWDVGTSRGSLSLDGSTQHVVVQRPSGPPLTQP